jgi:O-antigen/teichoic acid export membrane protein
MLTNEPIGAVAEPTVRRSLQARLLDAVGRSHRRAVSGFGWAGLSQVTCMAVRLCSNLVLTRLLAPEVFGLFASALAFLVTLELLCDLGVQKTLIRQPEGGRKEFLLTGWSLNLARGMVMTALLMALAYPAARFYGQPQLFPILVVLSLWSTIQTFRSPAWPLVLRETNYRAVFYDEVGRTVIQTVASIALAWTLGSIWAIVLGALIGVASGVVITHAVRPMRPKLMWDREALDAIAHLSRQVLFNTMVMILWSKFDQLVGLRFVALREMGYYAVAANLVRVAEALAISGCGVYFTLLARHSEPSVRAAMHQKVVRLIALAGMAVPALGVLIAPAVIGLLYDSRYAAAGLPCAILVARLMFFVLGHVQFQYLLSLAEVRLSTRAYVVALIVEAALFVPLVRAWGPAGMAICLLVSTAAYTGAQSLFAALKGLGSIRPFLITSAWVALSLVPMTLAHLPAGTLTFATPGVGTHARADGPRDPQAPPRPPADDLSGARFQRAP